MTLSLLARNRLEMALRNNGFHIPVPAPEGWIAADATFAPGRCFVAYSVDNAAAVVATSLLHVGHAFVEEGGTGPSADGLPPGAVSAFETPIEGLQNVVRRIFELSRSLPTAPLDRYVERIAGLPQRTDAERLVIQRVGQEVFREALMDLWSGRCAVTGLDQAELLRASHMKPWAECASDAERLDPMNGLLLAAHWDAAFDRGLVTFEDNGTALLSSKLTSRAVALLEGGLEAPRLTNLRSGHMPYLRHHRAYVWEHRLSL